MHNVNYLKERRKALRNNLTPAEAKLWTAIKNSTLKDMKFRRQHSIENYIVDFYCPEGKLIIELDGQVHFNTEQMAQDAERDRRLNTLGYMVLRFENKRVFVEPDEVLRVIGEHLNHP